MGFENDPTTMSAKLMARDLLEEINLGEGPIKRPTYISEKLSPETKKEVIQLLKEYKDCFTWDYDEMPGFSRELVDLKIPIKDAKNPITIFQIDSH